MNKEQLTIEEASSTYQLATDNCGLQKGYKQTEVGVIPEDWELSTLDELCTISSGTTPARSMADRYYRNGIVHWVKTLDLNNSVVIDTDECVTFEAMEETSLRPYPVGTVLVAMYGGFNQIGRTGLLRVPAAVNQAITAIQPKVNTLVSEYLLSILNFKVDYWKTVASSSRKDPNITSQDIRKFAIAYPSITEQRAITTVLSDVDALLAKLDQLITKKRDLKQAAMQQLLTGQARLPGFSGEWEIKILGDITQIATGNTPPTRDIENYGDEFMFVSPADLGTNKHILRTEKMLSAKGFSISRPFPKGSILFVCIGSTIGKCGIASELLTSNQQINAIIPSSEVSTDFLYYAVSMVAPKIKSLAGEQAVPIVNKTQFSETEIKLPSTKTEQSAIATILSDMDTEITALETRRDKTRDLKQGMMQELLTGRIRLV